MFTWFKPRNPLAAKASELYGLIVTASRRPDFYLDGGVPDTKEGRFSVLVMHLALVLERLRAEGGAGSAFGQAVIEAFVTDMDDNMREIGIGDTSVPRNVKKAAAALEARWNRYREALDSEPTAIVLDKLAGRIRVDVLGDALGDVLGDKPASGGTVGTLDGKALAAYMFDARDTLRATDGAKLFGATMPDLPVLRTSTGLDPQ
jgi:cytochrome b pre-mRNA-processing protein 3